MSHARLTHPDRPTLSFNQVQTDADEREAVANIARELAADRPALVHIQTRSRRRTLSGRVTAPRRARNDGTTSDWRQALANYVDRIEAHVDEFQGAPGYTFEDDIRNDSFNVVLESAEWALTQGNPYEFEYDITLLIGRGVFESQPIDLQNPTVGSPSDVIATVDGNDLPGLREMRGAKSLSFDESALYDKQSAENNEIVAEEGVEHRVTIRGTHTGSDATRAAADDNLQALIGGGQVTLSTNFPGYDIDGFVLGYNSDLESRRGTRSHDYDLTFIEGTPA